MMKDNKNIYMPKDVQSNFSEKALDLGFPSENKNQIMKDKSFNRRLNIKGIGFRAFVYKKQRRINLDLGLTHYISVALPDGINKNIKKTKIILSSDEKHHHVLGSFSAKIKGIKKKDPYKGKGVKLENEDIKLKVGKVKT